MAALMAIIVECDNCGKQVRYEGKALNNWEDFTWERQPYSERSPDGTHTWLHPEAFCSECEQAGIGGRIEALAARRKVQE